MSLIAMAVYCTEENQKDESFEKILNRIRQTVDLFKHRLFLCVNGATEKTRHTIHLFELGYELNWGRSPIEVIYNTENIGTARAINKAWMMRTPGEHCIKMDDDILIHGSGWVEQMEGAIAADPLIGQIGLKRKDCWEYPTNPNADFRSALAMLPHIPGHPWRIVERVKHVIGSCVMHSAALLDKVGYLYQPSLYGYDDVIMSHRTQLAGFYSCFLPHINIDHNDEGKTPYQGWKEKHSGEQTQTMINLVNEMRSGTKPIYYDYNY